MARRTVRLVGQESSVPLIIFIVTTVAALIGCYFLFNAWKAEETARTQLDRNINEAIHKRLLAAGETGINAALDSPEKSGAKTPYGDEFFAKYVDKLANRGVQFLKLCDLVGWDENSALGEASQEGSIRAYIAEGEHDNLKALAEATKKQLAECQQNMGQAQGSLKETQDKLSKEQGVRQQTEEGFKKQITELQAAVAAKDAEIKKVEGDAKGKVDAAHKEAVAAREELAKGKEDLKVEKAAVLTALNDAIGKVQNVLESNHKDSHVDVAPDASLQDRCAALTSLLLKGLTPTAVMKQIADFDGKILEITPDIGRAYINIGKIDGVRKGAIYTVYGTGKAGVRVAKAKAEVIKVDETFSTVGILEYNPRDPILPGDIIISPETLAAQTPSAPGAAAPAEGAETKKAVKEEKAEEEEGEKETKKEKKEEEEKEEKEETEKKEEGDKKEKKEE